MVRVIGVVGYKNSGKTTLSHKLTRELMARDHKVAMIKHASHHLDLAGKDTAILGESVDQVGIISPQESGIFWKRSLSLEDLILHMEADFVVVEGFKAEQTYPKILCLRGQPDDRTLFDGLAICAVGPTSQIGEMGVPVLDRDDVTQIADIVGDRSFKLPNLNCGDCGYERCYGLAQQIVAGSGNWEDCTVLFPAQE